MIKINGIKQEYDLFPNNEIKIPPVDKWTITDNQNSKDIYVEFEYDNSIDIVRLIFIKKHLDNISSANKYLIMKYIPYERMDRETKNQMFTCKYFCELINDLKFNKVFVLDPHSNVSVGILNNVEQISLENNINYIFNENYIDILCFPDVGANKKYTEILEDIKLPKIWANKHRDINTGRITDYDIVSDVDVKDKTILIIDDICVKGYTTLFCAKKLKELGAKSVIFYCSHCEENIHDGELLKTDYVDKIYTTDSLFVSGHSKINVIKGAKLNER